VEYLMRVLLRMRFGALVWLVCGVSYAQDTATFGTETIKVYRAEGYYEYNSDGVPLIGIIATRMDNNRVKFVTCNNRSLELDFNRLKLSKARCPAERRHPGIWSVDANKIAPVFKVGNNPTPMKVRFDGKIHQIGLPDSYKGPVSIARPDGLIGYAFKDSDGKKSLMILLLSGSSDHDAKQDYER
jgi:hypothetical protein